MNPAPVPALTGSWKTFLDRWQQATLALQLLAADVPLGGIVVRARSGPVRDMFLAIAEGLPRPLSRIHPAVTDEALFGGIDIAATLAQGTCVTRPGILDRGGTLILTMAERCPQQLAARLAAAMDRDPNLKLILLDEGADDDEIAPPALAERCALHVDLTDVAQRDITAGVMLRSVETRAVLPDLAIDEVTTVAAQLGITSLRAPQFALHAARALAGLAGRDIVAPNDLQTACQLTFAHRATQAPGASEAEPDETETPNAQQNAQAPQPPEDLILDAVRALLPDNLLDQLTARHARSGFGSGSGAQRKGNRRGRPLPARPGKLGDQARVDLISTLRAAAPWQRVRRQQTGRSGLHIRPQDIHTKRFAEHSDRLLIFTVDASGSAAVARLAEAKGAVELLLSQAYARRDHVSLVAFRGETAELLLPPTRSLVQTKRRLASLPGGGGTPLAAGLQEALEQSLLAQRKGLTPTVVLLTDGRANIPLAGPGANRQRAGQDALQMANALRHRGVDAVVIDTGNRPEPSLRTLAQTLDGVYLPMPRADANRLSRAVSTALDS
ncbi:MAG: magnesium chelatase subunit D [Pseudomonadota bacterium]